MRKLILLHLAVFVSFTSLIGCGDWKQDPMSGTGSLGPGQGKPDVKPQQPPPDPNFIFFEPPRFKVFKEGEETEIQVEVRVASPDYSVSLKVVNLSQFAGATFDSSTNTFKWNPPIGTAKSDMDNLPLEFVATATAPGKNAQFKQKTTTIGVTRTLIEPTITEVSSLTSVIREGETDYFYVTVEDQTAGSTEAEYPSLIARNTQGVPTMTNFVEIGRASKDSATKFEYVVEVNLAKAELTKNRTKLGFELVPVSSFHKAGPARAVTYDVLTSLVDVTSTWQESITAAPGAKIDYQFLVLDPKQEGKVTLELVDSVPAGAALTCSEYNSQAVLACRFVWSVPADAKGKYEVSARFKNSSTDYSDAHSKSTYLDLPILIGASAGRK